jgi:hypothetical protein
MLADQHKRDEFTKNCPKFFSDRIVQNRQNNGHYQAHLESDALRPTHQNFHRCYVHRKGSEGDKRKGVLKISNGQGNLGTDIENFDEMFFGTIHGFCAKFVREYHQKVNSSQDFETLDDDRKIWLKFISQINSIIDKIVPSKLRSHLTNHFKLSKILIQAHKIAISAACNTKFEPIPMENIVELFSHKAAANESKIQTFQRDVKVWMNYNDTCSFLEIPTAGGQKISKYFTKKYTGICTGSRRWKIFM